MYVGWAPPTSDEVRRLDAAAAPTGVIAELMLALLFTTAIRVGGLSRMPRVTAGDAWCITPGPVRLRRADRPEEKGGVRFPVAIAPCIRSILQRYDAPPSVHLCPSPRQPSRPRSTSFFKRRFRALCDRAGIVGPHAHIHTTRHTVAIALPPAVPLRRRGLDAVVCRGPA